MTAEFRGSSSEFQRVARLLLEGHLPDLLDHVRHTPDVNERAIAYSALAELLLGAGCRLPPLTDEIAAGIRLDPLFHKDDGKRDGVWDDANGVRSYRRLHTLRDLLTALESYEIRGGHPIEVHPDEKARHPKYAV